MASSVLEIAVEDKVATVTLNRPDRRNALSTELLAALRAGIAELDRDSAVQAIVLTGADPAFCAGLDLRELGSTGENLRTAGPSSGSLTPWPTISKPIVGAVNGPAITGGLEIALHCDFLLASERALFGDTHIRVGLLPGWGLSWLLPQAVGIRRAREMSLTGRLVKAPEALAWGLVNRVVAHHDLLGQAQQTARQITTIDPPAVAAMLELYTRTAAASGAEAAVIENEMSVQWMDRTYSPVAVAGRADAVIERGRAQI